MSLFSLACNSYGRFSSLFHHILLRLVYEPDWRRYYCYHCCRVAVTVRLLYLRIRRNTTRCFDNRRKSGIKIRFQSGNGRRSLRRRRSDRFCSVQILGPLQDCVRHVVCTSDLQLKQRTNPARGQFSIQTNLHDLQYVSVKINLSSEHGNIGTFGKYETDFYFLLLELLRCSIKLRDQYKSI